MSSSIDEQFIEYIVKSVVGNPDAVKIQRTIDEKGVLLELTVDPEDLGRVIGKRGATAQSLRTLLRALGTKNDARYNLRIIDVGGQRPPRSPQDDNQTNDSPADDHRQTNSDSDVSEKPAEETVEAETPVTKAEAIDMSEDDLPKTATKDTDHADLASRTRAELADLDDLDL